MAMVIDIHQLWRCYSKQHLVYHVPLPLNDFIQSKVIHFPLYVCITLDFS
jgi:hypothetical protein